MLNNTNNLFNQVQIIPDVNVYQQKKTLAQGMMDLALLSANMNQLRFVHESRNDHPYKIVSLVFITMSIILQVSFPTFLFLTIFFILIFFNKDCRRCRFNLEQSVQCKKRGRHMQGRQNQQFHSDRHIYGYYSKHVYCVV